MTQQPFFLLGTPIHQKKAYALEPFLKSLNDYKLDKYAIYIIDNSDTPDFSRQVDARCKRIGLSNYLVEHLPKMVGLEQEDRLARSREKFREFMLNGAYSHWLSVESDIILPPEPLKNI